jgi:RHS repeat-associated protein
VRSTATTDSRVVPHHFTAKERDTETGNDYFGERYYGSNMGRFMSTDPGPWRLENPQYFNMYSYGLNNPLRYGDDDGLTAQDRVNAANRLASQNIPYVSGGKNPGCGLDCSGLVQNVFKADPDNNIGLRLNAAGQAQALQNQGEFSTGSGNAKPGDAIFWSDSSGHVVHTGVVVDVRDGKIYFVHAPRPGKNVNRFYVKISSPNLGNERFAGVGRPREASSAQQQHTSFSQYANAYSEAIASWFTQLFFSQASQQQQREQVSHKVCWTDEKGKKVCQ